MPQKTKWVINILSADAIIYQLLFIVADLSLEFDARNSFAQCCCRKKQRVGIELLGMCFDANRASRKVNAESKKVFPYL